MIILFIINNILSKIILCLFSALIVGKVCRHLQYVTSTLYQIIDMQQVRYMSVELRPNINNYIPNRMQHRIFGRELTNLLDDRPRHKRTLSLLPHDLRLRELKAPVSTRNRSIIIPPVKPQPQKIDTQMVPEYLEQNIQFMRSQQGIPLGNYILSSGSISQNSRTKLVDWLCQIHYKFKMFPQTLFTAINLMDRYLSSKSVVSSELQLVAAASIFAAAKFEQTYQVPQAKQLLTACGGQYTKSQLLAIQGELMTVCNFQLIVDSAYKFYEVLAKFAAMEQKNIHLGQYILELALTKPKFLEYQPSLIASACVYLVRKIRRNQVPWAEPLIRLIGYKEGDLKACAKELCVLLEGAPEMDNCKAIRKKFSLVGYNEVTRIKLERRK